MKSAECKNELSNRTFRLVLSWSVGLLLLAAVVVLYVLYHQRNWCWVVRVTDMIRVWWYQFRIAVGWR